MKTCTSCRETKPVSDFRMVGGKYPGLKSKCRSCESAWRESYREQARAYGRSLSRPQTWPNGSPEKAGVMRLWRAENAARLAEYRRDKSVERKAHAHTRRARKRGAGGSYTRQDVVALYAAQNGLCHCCGVDLRNGYQVDHIFPIALGGTNDKTNIQLLCPPCNRRKGAKPPDEFMRKHGVNQNPA
jgi:5-methylcytosine-specific restriction endonuclease McrA